MPPVNVTKALEELASFNMHQEEVNPVPPNERVFATRDVNLVLELQKYEQKKVDIKRRSIGDRENFKKKASLYILSFRKMHVLLFWSLILINPALE